MKGSCCSKAGFTLIELLVVVLIIGILAAVALPQYEKAVVKSKFAKLKHLVAAVAQAQEIYLLGNGEYTDNFEALDIGMPDGRDTTQGSSSEYFYDWGKCWLAIGDSGAWEGAVAGVICRDDSIEMSYRAWLRNLPAGNTENSGARQCIVKGANNTIGQSICAAETGDTNPHESDGNKHYTYQ